MNGNDIKVEVPEIQPEPEKGSTKCENEKKFLCHVCSKSFLHRHHLEVHLKVHDGSKDFACDICSKQFRYCCCYLTSVFVLYTLLYLRTIYSNKSDTNN